MSALDYALPMISASNVSRSAGPASYRIRAQDIRRGVCRAFRLDMATLDSPTKRRVHFEPRALAMWLIKSHTNMSYPEIGRRFGGRDHTTVMSAVRRYQSWINDGVVPEPNVFDYLRIEQ